MQSKLLRINIDMILFVFIVFISFRLTGQPIEPEYISIGEGLSSADVQAILQDSYGLIWIGTTDGLNKYDGYKFDKFKNVPGEPKSLLDNNIWGLVEDDEKNIWVATEIGVSKFIRDRNEFINYNFQELFKTTSAGNRVFNLFIDSNKRLWSATSNLGFTYYDAVRDKWKTVPYQINDTTVVPGDSDLGLGITEDSNGKIWIGSYQYGLSYQGKNDTVFYPAEFKTNNHNIDFTQSENTITYLYNDPANVIWITTRNGIYKYYPDTKELKAIKEYNYSKFILWNHWNSIIQDDLGNVWIGNNFRGILKFDGISDDYEEIKVLGRNRNRDGNLDIIITNCMIDKTGIFWFTTTTEGIIKYDPSKEPFLLYKADETDNKSLSSNQIFSLLESQVHNNKIYVGTRGGGLNIFDQNKKTFSQINFKAENDLFGGSVRSIAEEEDGSLWLGSWGDGLIKMNSRYKEIKRFTNDSLNSNSLSDNAVRVIKKDRNGDYWIGTNRGLNIFNPRTKKNKRISSANTRLYPQELTDIALKLMNSSSNKAGIHEVGDDQNLTEQLQVIKPRSYLVISMGEGSIENNLFDYGWVESANTDTVWGSKDGANSFHAGGALKNRVKFDLLQLKPGKYSLKYASDDSHSFNKWNDNPPTYPKFWGITLIEIDDESLVGKIQQYLDESKNQLLIKGQNIRSILISKNIVWIGTDAQGLNKIDQDKNKVTYYSHDEKEKNSLSNNSLQFIHEDKEGILWLATNAGLNRFDPLKETFKIFTEQDGLPTNYIASILPSSKGGLWLATRNGISKMVTDEETGQITFVNYDNNDGLGGQNFIALVALKAANGQYYFGGEHGLNSFTPKKSNNAEPSLIFTDLKISNQSIKSFPPDERPIEASLFEVNEIALPYNQNDLTFEFAALHYSNPLKNQYAHKLIGYDNDWIFNNKREVTYTNLDPGEYTFSIKGSNRDGVWNSDGKSIKITINPPWWFTTLAYVGYGFLFVGIIFGVDRVQRRRLIKRAKEKLRIQNIEHRAEAAELKAKVTESERRALEAEYELKKKELEEARQLQLSMLPKELPKLPHLDIAVYMKTATEVGGDYYDFHIGLDGTLTVVLGDATGHGMKAGTMVTTTKSLFNVLAPNPNIVETFHEMTRCLKLMHMEKLSMCMTMIKIIGNKIQMSAAGMPPIFIYKRESQSIEEHMMKGMPLGTFSNFPYSLVECDISSGDTILMMSDGFPELMNNKKEMFGYKQARNLFEEVSGESSENIISKLKTAGTEWTNDADPDDDVTFVVLKMK